MQEIMRRREILAVLVLFFGVFATTSFSSNVTYDHRALLINGKRRVLISGSIHYPRSTPEVIHFFFSPSHWSFFYFLFLLTYVSVGVDVARPYTKIQRWRSGCYRDLRILEWTRTSSKPGALVLFFLCPPLILKCYVWLQRKHEKVITFWVLIVACNANSFDQLNFLVQLGWVRFFTLFNFSAVN